MRIDHIVPKKSKNSRFSNSQFSSNMFNGSKFSSKFSSNNIQILIISLFTRLQINNKKKEFYYNILINKTSNCPNLIQI